MKIGNLDTSEQVLLIAEIGNNHEGDLDVAKKMIRAAAAAGANAVKFQTIVPDRLVSVSDSARIRQLEKFQFSPDEFVALCEEARRHEVLFLSTPFDLDSVGWLNELVAAWKISSGDNDFLPLIDRVAATGKPIIVSMGLVRAENATELIQFINDSWRRHGVAASDIALLHCRVSYPTPPEEAGLGSIERLKIAGVTPGYSDHTIGIRAAELAVAAGARIIEKHFTLDKNFSDFRDHKLSADPGELKQLVNAIGEIETLFQCSDTSEADNERAVRRSIAAARDLPIGHVVAWDDLCWVRPRVGLKPGQENLVQGRTLTKPVAHGQAFTEADFE